MDISILCKNTESLLSEYKYDYDSDVLKSIISTSIDRKSGLRNILSKSQYWDEDMDAIVLKEKTIMRSYDMNGVETFRRWAEMRLIDKEEADKRAILNFIFVIMSNSFGLDKGNLIDVSYIENNYRVKDFERMDGFVPFVNGQKWSRYIGNVCKKWGLNTITDVREESYTDNNTGEVRTRTKDYGYNYHFSLLADSINPLEIKGKTFVISLNFIDYLTMSFGNNWASCHTIDKSNYRSCRGYYSGEYSSGTMSYALDYTTMIAYVVDESNDPKEGYNSYHKFGSDTPYYFRDKEHREVVSWGEDKLYFARVYPDGRDGGDGSIASQFREIIQQIFAECLDVPNMWLTKKGYEATDEMIRHGMDATCYADWESCSDGAMSYLKHSDGSINENYMTVGACPLCVKCGHNNYSDESIVCEDCDDGDRVFCAWCDDRFDLNRNDDYVEVNDRFFCCPSCARDAGYIIDHYGDWEYEDDCVVCEDDGDFYLEDDDSIVYCENDGNYHFSHNCNCCERTGDWYFDVDGINTADGFWYHDEDSAEADGYVYCDDDDEWHHVG